MSTTLPVPEDKGKAEKECNTQPILIMEAAVQAVLAQLAAQQQTMNNMQQQMMLDREESKSLLKKVEEQSKDKHKSKLVDERVR